MVKFKELSETNQKVVKFRYLTELLAHLSYQSEKEIPLISGRVGYDRGSSSWSKERVDDFTLFLRTHTKASFVSKSIQITIQGNEVFVEYKANKRGLSYGDHSLVFKIADLAHDEYEGLGLEHNEEVVPLAYELIGDILFEDLLDQLPKLVRDLKIPKSKMLERLDMYALIFTSLGKLRD